MIRITFYQLGEFLLFYIIFTVAFFKIFGKAGIRRWLAFIPGVNLYFLFKLVWSTKYFWAFFGCLVIAGLSWWYSNVIVVSAESSGYDFFKTAAAFALPTFGIIALIMYVFLCRRITDSFNLSTGWTVALVLLFPAIFLVIGLGWPQYHGNAYMGEFENTKKKSKKSKNKKSK